MNMLNEKLHAWLHTRQQGLYCVPGDFYIDPISSVDFAIVTHGHLDHARSGHQHVLATSETLRMMALRYGQDFAVQEQALNYHQTIHHKNVAITLLPAGHILGSAQVVLEYQGERIVVSGDYKRADDPTCLPFEPVTCDIFVTESTFALPIFNHPPLSQELAKLFASLQQNPDRCHLIGCYPLGKCQRLITELRDHNYHAPIYLHGAHWKLCELYNHLGHSLGELKKVSDLTEFTCLKGAIVLAPPSALKDRWTRKLPNVIHAFASGWMQIRAHAKRRGVELPLIISDHADWQALTKTIDDVQAPEIWVTHGIKEALVYYVQQKGLKAVPIYGEPTMI